MEIRPELLPSTKLYWSCSRIASTPSTEPDQLRSQLETRAPQRPTTSNCLHWPTATSVRSLQLHAPGSPKWWQNGSSSLVVLGRACRVECPITLLLLQFGKVGFPELVLLPLALLLALLSPQFSADDLSGGGLGQIAEL